MPSPRRADRAPSMVDRCWSDIIRLTGFRRAYKSYVQGNDVSLWSTLQGSTAGAAAEARLHCMDGATRADLGSAACPLALSSRLLSCRARGIALLPPLPLRMTPALAKHWQNVALLTDAIISPGWHAVAWQLHYLFAQRHPQRPKVRRQDPVKRPVSGHLQPTRHGVTRQWLSHEIFETSFAASDRIQV